MYATCCPGLYAENLPSWWIFKKEGGSHKGVSAGGRRASSWSQCICLLLDVTIVSNSKYEVSGYINANGNLQLESAFEK